ncbi:hypothetical protein SDJN02_17020, partial [Cucurbita argyrosperma subsp. argyrosperma]
PTQYLLLHQHQPGTLEQCSPLITQISAPPANFDLSRSRNLPGQRRLRLIRGLSLLIPCSSASGDIRVIGDEVFTGQMSIRPLCRYDKFDRAWQLAL